MSLPRCNRQQTQRPPLPIQAGSFLPRNAPPRKQYGRVTKFLLRSRAPASGGFFAEAVGTRQGCSLTLHERAKFARPSMRSHSDVNYFFFFAGKENPPCIAQVPSGARVLCAAKRTLDGFCATHYTGRPAKKKSTRCSLPLVDFARQPSIRTHKWTMRSGALCHTGECCYLDFGLQEGSCSP